MGETHQTLTDAACGWREEWAHPLLYSSVLFMLLRFAVVTVDFFTNWEEDQILFKSSSIILGKRYKGNTTHAYNMLWMVPQRRVPNCSLFQLFVSRKFTVSCQVPPPTNLRSSGPLPCPSPGHGECTGLEARPLEDLSLHLCGCQVSRGSPGHPHSTLSRRGCSRERLLAQLHLD